MHSQLYKWSINPIVSAFPYTLIYLPCLWFSLHFYRQLPRQHSLEGWVDSASQECGTFALRPWLFSGSPLCLSVPLLLTLNPSSPSPSAKCWHVVYCVARGQVQGEVLLLDKALLTKQQSGEMHTMVVHWVIWLESCDRGVHYTLLNACCSCDALMISVRYFAVRWGHKVLFHVNFKCPSP